MKISMKQYAELIHKHPHLKPDSPTQSPKPERPVRNEPVAKKERESANPSRVRVCVKSFRKRLIDPDNLCPKYFIDCLRYAGLIPDDRAQDIELLVTQEKSKDERTEIQISTIH